MANFLLGSKGLKSLLLAHPMWGLSLQVPEGIPHGAVSTLCATQMHSAPALHLLPLALREPATSPVHPPSGRHLQLQPRRLLHQVRRGHRPLPGGRRVSAPPPAARRQRNLMFPGSDALRIGQAESEKPARGCFWEYCAAWPAFLWPGPGLRSHHPLGEAPSLPTFGKPYTGFSSAK